MAADLSGLSVAATRLLRVLRAEQDNARNCAHPVTHLTDRQLVALAGLPQRDLVDAAGELLAAGVLALADDRGRWIGTPREALRYTAGLKRRAILILNRRRLVRQALARRGQLQLALGAHAS